MITVRDVLDYYIADGRDNMQMARLIRDYLVEHEETQQGLARTMQSAVAQHHEQHPRSRLKALRPGTIHHFMSLLELPESLQAAVSDRSLAFKSARAIADIRDRDPETVVRLAGPFLDGTFNSVLVEKYVSFANEHPAWTVEDLISAVRGNPPKPPAPPPSASRMAARAVERIRVRPADVLKATIELKAMLPVCDWDNSIDTLQARSWLSRLQTEIATATTQQAHARVM